MTKNNHPTGDLYDNLDRLFSEQFVSSGDSADDALEKYLATAATYAGTESCIAVLSDLREKRSYIFFGGLAETLGIANEGSTMILDTIWEEIILSRISPEDLERKQLEEIRFFSFVTKHPDSGHLYFMCSCFPMSCSSDRTINVRHRIFYFHIGRTVRYALCLYNASAMTLHESTIINMRSGEEVPLYRIDSSCMLSEREKQVLRMIADGLSSKEIACRLGISVFTVSRHRQNIIAAMNVKNSSQACQLAHQMGLV